jgi:alpha-beta hydrolase superfamily lysophospholipase
VTAPHQTDPRQIETREFVAARPVPDPRAEDLPVESQAALRQFSLARITAYGVDPADAAELRGRVLDGQRWREAATTLARRCEEQADLPATGDPTRVEYLRRASALLRTSQVMMLTDTPERRALYEDAARLYARAGDLSRDRHRVAIDTPGGTVVGWLVPAREAVGSAIVVGGVEGYGMDFTSLGEALAARGVDALLLDGPGQGETRFAHSHYLTRDWRDAYRAVIDWLADRAPGRPVAIVGNSMGGSLAVAVATADPRIRACCDNGGIPAPGMVPPSIGTFFTKMVAFCGDVTPQEATEVWSTVTPLEPGPNSDYPLLVVHGGADPLVSDDMARALFERAPTQDRQMVVFSDGDHCLYNHRSDRDALIADWVRSRLGAPVRHDVP